MTAVRDRDGRCIVSGKLNRFNGLDAAHIFPLAQGAHWIHNNFDRWITDGSESINSVENGILLRADLHREFDMFTFSINPDVW